MSLESGTSGPREARITELQNEVNSLCRQHGQIERYALAAPSVAPTEDALRISEAFNRSIIESSPDCIKVLDLEGNLLAMPNGHRILGIDCVQPYLHTSWLDFWTGGDRQAAQAAVEAAAAGGTQSFVGFFRTLAGVPKWWDVVVSPIFDSGDKPARLLVLSRDVTRQKQAEDVLRQRTALIETLVDEAPLGIYLIDAGFRIRHVNPTALPVFGNIPDLIGSDFTEVMHILWPKDKADETMARFRETMKTGQSYHVDEWIEKRVDGQRVEHYEWQISRIQLPDGYGAVCYFRDISRRIRAQEKIRESEAHLRAFVMASSDLVYRMNVDWTEMRPLFGQRFLAGHSVPDIQWLHEYIFEEDQPQVMESFRAASRSKTFFSKEHRIRRMDGTAGWAVSRAVPLLDAQGEIIEWIGASTDVTDRRRTARALRETQERYRTLFNSIDEGFCVIEVIFDANGKPADYRFLEVNPSFDAQTGMTGAVGKRVLELVPDLEAHWYERFGKVALTGEAVRFAGEATAMDGRWFDVYAFRLGGAQSRRVAVLFNNVTEQKRAERQLREQALALANQDRRKDEFLAMLGHELRNPLAPISSALHLLRLQANEGPAQRQARTVIERQVGQINQLVDELLEVARITTGRIQLRQEPVALGGVIERALETVQPLIAQRRHELTVALPPEPLWLHADASRLEQVIVNLLANAAKYTDEGGRIDLSACREDGAAVLRVRDTGIGIAPELLPHIFELFTQAERSLDRSQGGLGIGLCLVRRLVELHGGTVAAQSVPGQGSEFTVRLPLAQAALPASAPELDAPVRPPLKPCRVLVVDDNVDAAETLAMLLEVSGHAVKMAHEGLSALRIAQAWLPDVMLLDIGLPGFSGYEVAKRVRVDGTLKSVVLIALTGYGQEADRERSRQAGFDHHLVKPASFALLEEILASVVAVANAA